MILLIYFNINILRIL